MNNNEWKKICAACAEGTPPERCAYYGDPNGCNAPTLGAHPEGDLAEQLQEALEKAEKRIAELERATGNAAAMRAALSDLVYNIEIRAQAFGIFSIVDKKTWLDAKAALAAPARNCDRFATEDEAREAYWAYREPLEFNNKPFVAITEWLFDKAEGGAE